MMRAVFALDHRFIPHGGRVLSEAQLPAESWSRYLRVFDEIIVLSRQGGVPPGKRVDDLNVSSRPRVEFRFVPDLASPLAQVCARSRAIALVRRTVEDADAVIARMPSETGLIASAAARELGKPWAAEVCGCPWDGLWHYGNWQGKVYAPVMAWRVRRALAGAPFAIYVTRRFLQGRYPCKEGHAVGCSDVDIATPGEDVLRRRLDTLESARQPLVFGLVGSLRGKVKGIHTALGALQRARRDLPPFEFRILGAGDPSPWRSMAQAAGLADVTRFDGTVPSGDPVLAWLDAVDVYLQPSFKEGLPRALIEAMSRGCPAIASSVAGIPELLEPQVLHRPGDAARLASLLVRAARDLRWRRQQAERNWREASEYSRANLEGTRNRFWDEFAARVRAAQVACAFAG